MAEKPTKVAAKKLKKKRWYPILAPQLFGDKILGESNVYDSSALSGKYLTVNLMNVTGDPKKQSILARFRITQVVDAKGITELEYFQTIPSSLKRIIRKGRDKVGASFLCITQDKKIVRVKPLAVTVGPTHDSVRTAIRKKMGEIIINEVYNLTLENLFKSVLSGEIQRTIRNGVKKIYPVRNIEFTFVGLETKKRYSGAGPRLLERAEAFGAKDYAERKHKEQQERYAEKKAAVKSEDEAPGVSDEKVPDEVQ